MLVLIYRTTKLHEITGSHGSVSEDCGLGCNTCSSTDRYQRFTEHSAFILKLRQQDSL
jgi:hypothetical protein